MNSPTRIGILVKATAIEIVVGRVLHGAVHLDPTRIVLSECRHPRTRKSGSRLTPCWREVDSNHRFLDAEWRFHLGNGSNDKVAQKRSRNRAYLLRYRKFE